MGSETEVLPLRARPVHGPGCRSEIVCPSQVGGELTPGYPGVRPPPSFSLRIQAPEPFGDPGAKSLSNAAYFSLSATSLAPRGPSLVPLPSTPASITPSLRPRAKADKKKELIQLLETYQLPSFPLVVTVALQKLRDPESSLSEVAERLAADPGVSAHLLRVTNSAAFSLRREIQSVHHAVSLLGRNEVEALLIASSVKGALPHRPGPGFAPNRFWKAAGRRAAAAKALAGVLHPDTKSESFTSALLEDMAIPLLAAVLRRGYGSVLLESYARGYDLAQLELSSFGWTHADAAGWMCKQWGFPKRITLAIERHHYTDLNAVGVLPAVSLVSLMQEPEQSGNEELIEAVHSYSAIPRDKVSDLVAGAVQSSDEVARIFVRR